MSSELLIYEAFKKVVAKTPTVALVTYYAPVDGSRVGFCALQDKVYGTRIHQDQTSLVADFDANIVPSATLGSSTDDAYVRAFDAALPDGTATTSSVAASITNVTLLSANARRRGASFILDAGAGLVPSVLYIKHGATASTSSFATTLLALGEYYSLPLNANNRVYTGRVDGIWLGTVGSVKINEET